MENKLGLNSVLLRVYPLSARVMSFAIEKFLTVFIVSDNDMIIFLECELYQSTILTLLFEVEKKLQFLDYLPPESFYMLRNAAGCTIISV